MNTIMMPTIIFATVSIIIAICFLAYYYSVRYLEKKRKKAFEDEYQVSLSEDFRVKENNTNKNKIYELVYPYWLYANKDGSQNKVRASNSLIYGECKLYYNQYIIITKYPVGMIKLVHILRDKYGDNDIEKNSEELDKANEKKENNKVYKNYSDIQSIIDLFRENPTEFENYCANLYEAMGYDAKITSKTNDGGYDIVLRKDNEKTIVECKCFAQRHPIGRPLIQKLVGANQQAQADEIVFITTSSFTKEAIEYAKETDVQLVDGNKLVKIAEQYLGTKGTNSKKLRRKDWELNADDVLKMCPPDYYER